ncbi:MAG TPA: Ppx/GppA phosphatase family protein [Vicinamibacteria bacterium]|nr:Ppx/GppA phosphatase family protein [Vicinamibacteria bacterium]
MSQDADVLARPTAESASRPVAVLDMGATAVRLLVAEVVAGQPIRILEEASRAVQLGKDAFTGGRLGASTIEATLRALEGFRRIMDSYGVVRYRAVATSAVREAVNRDTFVDRVRLRTGIDIEVIDGSEENRLTYIAVREALRGHEALVSGNALLVEVGGGSADLSFLRHGEPAYSGTYALGAVRMRQGLAGWHGSHDQRVRLFRRTVQNIVEDIRREVPLREARHFVALGGDVRFAADQIVGEAAGAAVRGFPRERLIAFCEETAALDDEELVDRYKLPLAEVETLVPALLVYRELALETQASEVLVPEASLRAGLLLDMVRTDDGQGMEDFSRQVLASAAALGEKYRYDAPHARQVAMLATRLFDDLRLEHGLSARDRLLLEVAALLHDIGIFVSLRSHHKHAQYILSVSELFGLSREDMAIIGNVARYHRRAAPNKSHLPYMALDSESRVLVNKLGAILRVANALDADHLQKVREVHVLREEDQWVLDVDGGGDLTLERLAALARADLMVEVFGRKVAFRETGSRT